MSKFIDLEGFRFGRLIVLKRMETNSNGKVTWLCRCDCGTEKIIVGESLKQNLTFSCGCLKKESVRKTHLIDLSGKKFGNLHALELYNVNSRKEAVWKCVCKCGNKINIVGSHLTKGLVVSCVLS